MVGTFYRAAEPAYPRLFETRQPRSTVGQPVCILEAMKLMNELWRLE